MKIALGGPPKSGKSVLRQRLKMAIQRLDPNVHPYVLTTNPDGEGAWFQETYRHDPEAAARLKQSAKQAWSAEHADLYASWVRNAAAPLVLIDLGGKIDDKNLRICALATHAILIAPSDAAFPAWREFCSACQLTLLAELLSDLTAPDDRIDSAGVPFRAVIHHLERGDIDTPRPAVDALARLILDLLPHA